MKRIIKKLAQSLFGERIWHKCALCKGHFVQWFKDIWPIIKNKLFFPHAVYLVLTPEHTNLGDHAIALATRLLLDRYNIRYQEISVNWLYSLHPEPGEAFGRR